MPITRLSASNAAKLYQMSFAKDYLKDTEWQFVPRLTTEHVWDAFVIFSLLEDKKQRHERLCVPHIGDQASRFTEAMEQRNRDFIINGQPDAILHACDKCLRIYQFDGIQRKVFLSWLKAIVAAKPNAAIKQENAM